MPTCIVRGAPGALFKVAIEQVLHIQVEPDFVVDLVVTQRKKKPLSRVASVTP